ncbi:MAG: hypothetical protein ABIP85_16565, partial [Chthoniobacteraceae bacterium]
MKTDSYTYFCCNFLFNRIVFSLIGASLPLRRLALLLAAWAVCAMPYMARTQEVPNPLADTQVLPLADGKEIDRITREAQSPANAGRVPPATVIGGAWIPLGPASTQNGQVTVPPNNEIAGCVQAVAVHPTNPDIIYIGSIGGGVWRTLNGTAASPAWTPLTDTQATLNIGAVEFDTNDATRQTLVVGTARTSSFAARGGALVGMLRTTDGGNTWSTLGTSVFSNENLTSVAARGSILLAASDDVSAGNGSGLFRSTDTGGSFTLVSGGSGLPAGPVSDLVADPNISTRFFAAVRTGGIFRSDDTGATWTNVTGTITGITASTTKIEMAMVNNGVTSALYVAVLNSTALESMWRSTNLGTSWTQMDTPVTGGQTSLHFAIAADPSNSSLVYVGGQAGRFRGDASLAAGSQFTSIQGANAGNTTPHADAREMVIDADGNLLEGSDGGIYRRMAPQGNGGVWVSVIGNLATFEAHDVAYDSVTKVTMIGTQDNGTHIQTTSTSTVWTSISGGDGGDVAIDDTSSPGQSIRYGSSQNLGGFYRKTYNSSNTLLSTASPALTLLSGSPAISTQFVTPVEVNKVAPTRLAIGGSNSVYESLDQGNSVTALSVGFGVNRMALAYGGRQAGVPNPDVLYFGSGSTVRRRTTSGGAVSATPTAFPGGTVQDIILDSNDWTRVFVADSSAVYVTPDSGTTWQNITGNLTDVGTIRCLEYFSLNGTDCVAAGTGLGVYVSFVNNLGVWSRLGTGMPNVVAFDMSYNSTDKVLAVGTLGRSAFLLKVGLPTLTVGTNINITKSAENNSETFISINPTNPLNLFATSTSGSNVFKYSTDGGATWNNSNISGVLGGGSGGDQQSAWDNFGNLFVTYFAGASNHTVLALSTNGGATFSLLVDTGALFDQPNVAVGSGAVWFDYTNSKRTARGAAVTGLGLVGAFSAPQTMPGNQGSFGDLAIGPAGQVLDVYQTQTGVGPSEIYANLNPTGVGGTFGAQIDIGPVNVGDFAPIPAQPDRTIDAETGLAWDRSGGPHNGRVYLVYTDRPTTSSADTDIYVRFSDNNGSTWSSRVRVNDDTAGNGKSQFFPRIALDQTTGNIAVSFYDCRNSAGNNTVQLWATASVDGGLTFLPNIQVSTGTTDGTAGGLGGFDLGDYNGLDFYGGVFYPSWADNSNSTADNPAGAGGVTDIYTARVSLSGSIITQPTVTAPTGISITATSATLGGNVTSDGGATIIERGVVYSITSVNGNPLIGGAGVTKVTGAGTTGVFTVNATDLTAGAGYSFKAYAINSVGTGYTAVSLFSQGTPSVIAPTSTGITANSATLGGNVTGDGGSAITERGVVYAFSSVNSNPQIGGTGVTQVTGAGNTGVFTVNAIGLSGGTGYSFAAYATNGIGTTYTTPVATFATLAVAPTVTTPTQTAITAGSATLGGNVTSDGGAAITERGIVYSVTTTNGDPLIGGTGVTKVTGTGTTGVFTVNVTGLIQNTGYSFKAYATNGAGTNYTTPASTFTTAAASLPTVSTPTQTAITAGSATLGGNVTSDGGATITERGIVYSITSTNADPLIGGTGVIKVTSTGTTGAFTLYLSGLAQNTGYSFKAYATNSVGTAYTTPVSTFTTLVAVALTGTKTVGTGGDYSSLTNGGGLFDTINGNGVNGSLNIQIVSDLTTETGTVALNVLIGTTPSLKIFPTGTARVVSGSIAGALIRLNGADNVILDGSLNGTGTDRSLTVTNTSTTTPTVISLMSLGTGLGATNDVVKNCNISTGVALSIGYGISVGGTTPGTNGADNDNISIQNNSITAAPIGIFASGTSSATAGGDDNLLIVGNSIAYNSTLASIGIRVGNAVNSSVSQNTVSEQTTVSQSPTAISLETGFVSSSVTRNTVTKSLTTSTSGYAGRGITVGTGTATSALTIANNIIYGVNGSNWSDFSNSSAMGIAIGTIGSSSTLTTTAGGVNLYFNSVNMSGSMGSGATTAITAAIYIGSGASALDMRNNVFVNTQVGTSATQKNYAIYSAAANSAFTTIDYNDYFVSNTFNAASAVPGFLTSDRVDLAGIQAGFLQNTHSFTSDPLFLSTTDLHIASSSSPVSNAGTPIAGVLVDFDGDTRSASTPDVGVDEFTGKPVVTTPTQTAITATTSVLGGNVTGDGGGPITERGVVYSIATVNADPLIGGTGVTQITSPGTTGVFTVNATGLTQGTGYSFRAYATNSAGTTYTTPVSTFAQGAPDVTTPTSASITSNSATLGGNVTSDSGSAITERGVVYSITTVNANPLIGGTGVVKLTSAGTTGVFTVNATGLTQATSYSFKAYAINSMGTSYTTPVSTFTTLAVALTGTKTVGTGGDYTSLTNAGGLFEAININGVNGLLSVQITGDLSAETGAVALNALSGTTPSVKIFPTVTARAISGTSTGALIRVNAADNITLDGSLGGTGTDRSMSVTNTSTGTTSAVIWIQSSGIDGATNNTIKNLNVAGNGNAQTLFGIGAGSSTISLTSVGTGNNSNTIQNNSISKTQYGIYSQGSSAAAKNTGNIITQNLINAASPNNVKFCGIRVGFENGILIANNKISNLSTTGSLAAIAVGFSGVSFSTSSTTGNDVTNATITGNLIGSVLSTSTTGFSAMGIAVSSVSSGTTTIANNIITGVSALSTASDFAAGIFSGGGTGASLTNIHYNSVSMTGTRGAASYPSYALAIGGTSATSVDVRNNALYNTQTSTSTGKSYAIGLA